LRRGAAAWIACIAWAAPAFGADPPRVAIGGSDAPFELSADQVEYERSRDLYIASGKVKIKQAERTLSADWVAFSNTTQRGVASGNVIISDGTDTLRTSFVEFDIATFEGVLFDARMDAESNQFRMSGTEIAKTGPQTYHFENGRFTTCQCDDGSREPWLIEAERADLEINGYGTARNTRFEVLGVPVVWVPWMIYPLKTERQTGLLFPQISAGSIEGFALAVPFFWAVRENVNVLIKPGWSVKRGFSDEVATEYVFGEESSGRTAGAYHRDQDIKAHTPSEPFSRNRWATWGEQDVFLPWDVRFKSSFAFVSDNQYPSDFGELSMHRNDRFLESTAFATRVFGEDGSLGLMAAAEHADDLQSPDDLDRDDFIVQRVPELALSLLPEPALSLLPESAPVVPQLVPALDLQYVFFRSDVSRNAAFEDTGIDGLFDAEERGPAGADPGSGSDLDQDDFVPLGGTEGDGMFQEGERLVDRGQRAWLTPRLGVPVRLGDFVELYPEAGWSQMLYDSDAFGLEEHGFATARVELRTRLRRRFGESLTHILEPRVGYALIEEVSGSDEQLFVPTARVAQRRLRELTLENVTRDPADRIEDFDGMTFGFSNRLWGTFGKEDAPRMIADASMIGQYDFEGNDLGLIVVDGRAYPFERTTTRVSFGFDPEDAHLEETLFEVAQAFTAGHRIGVRYRYLRNVPAFYEDFPYAKERFHHFEDFDHVSQLDLYLRATITETWAATYLGSYSFERGVVLRNRGGIEYFSRCRCWAVRLEIEQDRERGVNFNLMYTLSGLGDDRHRPFEPSGVPGFGLLDGT
jgi:lipopolysaccharide export system protein LptA